MATKVLQCLCCPTHACGRACCIDQWHGMEACGLSYVYCDACCWALCAPICLDLKLGDAGKAGENCIKSLKYCLFACALDFVAPVDGIYNCVKVIGTICGSGLKGNKDIMENTQWLNKMIKDALKLETGN